MKAVSDLTQDWKVTLVPLPEILGSGRLGADNLMMSRHVSRGYETPRLFITDGVAIVRPDSHPLGLGLKCPT